MENIPDEKGIVDILGKLEILKIDEKDITLSLEAHNKINIQPKGTILGVKVEVEDTGNIIPTITFDTKKLKDKNKTINTKELLDNAIEEYNERI